MVAPECISLLVSQKIRDPGGGGFKTPPPPPPSYDLKNYCINRHHIMHVHLPRCI